MNDKAGGWLARGVASDPAIVIPGERTLTYRQLRSAIERLSAGLEAYGVGPGDCVALVLPGGLAAALGFLATVSTAVAAPLNAAYRSEEFRFYLNDLGVRALISARGSNTDAATVISPGVLHFELDVQQREPRLELVNGPQAARAKPGAARDVSLLLHTSGTTDRPKLVPLTTGNLRASVQHIIETLHLAPEDRCLNVMPLFHIHGLVAGLLTPLAAGGSVVLPEGFDAFAAPRWIEEELPTSYTAVPTIHQLLLQRSAPGMAAVGSRLRFIRSSSAALPPAVIGELEARFQVPVVEAYGMTEAAHQITSNPLSPGVRKAGTVGTGNGVEVRVIGETGGELPVGETGEVAIRGPNVMSGYLGNAEANSAAFVGGWFRTGDQGSVDPEGYLRLTGRLKEIINRGGEKVSPREVDEALLLHPAVAQAVAFSLPHALLGEEIGAAVVLREGCGAGERELRRFVAERLAPFKVPRRIVFLSQIPKGPTGKVQRIGLARRLGLVAED